MLCHGHRSSNTTPLFSRARSKSREKPPGLWECLGSTAEPPAGTRSQAAESCTADQWETWPEPRTAPWRRGPFLGVSHDNNLKSAFKSTTFSWPGPMMALWHSSFLSLVKHIVRFLDRKGGPAKASMPKQGKNRWRRYWGGNISTVAHKLNFTTSSFAFRSIHSLRCLPSACYETGSAGMKWRRKENG